MFGVQIVPFMVVRKKKKKNSHASIRGVKVQRCVRPQCLLVQNYLGQPGYPDFCVCPIMLEVRELPQKHLS